MSNDEKFTTHLKAANLQLYEILSPKDIQQNLNKPTFDDNPLDKDRFQLVQISDHPNDFTSIDDLLIKLRKTSSATIEISNHNTEQQKHTSRKLIENSTKNTNFVFDSLTFTELLINNLEITVSITTGAATVLKISKDILVEWIKADASREIEITYDNKTVKIKGGKDIDKFLKTIEKKVSKK